MFKSLATMGLTKGPKKREASSQNGPPSKKRKDKSVDSFAAEKATEKKSKSLRASSSKPSKPEPSIRKAQRKVPITSTQLAEESSGSESDLDGEDGALDSDGIEGEEGDFEGVEEEEAEFEDGGEEDEGMDADGAAPQKETKSVSGFISTLLLLLSDHYHRRQGKSQSSESPSTRA